MVTSTTPTLAVEGKLIIFPAYVFYLQKNGYIINHRNDKHSNRKLNEILMKANLANALGQNYDIPEIVIFSEGKWTAKRLGEHQVVLIDAGKYGQYHYYPTLLKMHNDTSVCNVIQSFVMQYSSAKIQVVKRG